MGERQPGWVRTGFRRANGGVTGSGVPGPRLIYSQIGLALLGLTQTDPSVADDYDEFTKLSAQGTAPAGWVSNNSGTGVVGTAVVGFGGGDVLVDAGATAGSTGEISNSAQMVANLATGKAYIACRFQFPTATDAQSVLSWGWRNAAANKTILFGHVATLNAANFIVQYDGNQAGSTLNLAVALDQSVWHIGEMWLSSGTLQARIDGGTIQTAIMGGAAPTDYGRLLFRSRNGATNASRQLLVDWIYTLVQRS